jgi:hypothetical protein
MKATVTKTDFEKWLKSKKPNSIVGIAKIAASCPLARYFLELNKLPVNSVFISNDVSIHDSNGNEYSSKFKLWMCKFTNKVDLYEGTLSKDCKDCKISAKEALEILAEC